MALNLGYYIEKDSGMGSTPRLKNFKKTNKGNVVPLDFSDEDPMVIGGDSVTDTVSFKSLTPNDGGATGNGEANSLNTEFTDTSAGATISEKADSIDPKKSKSPEEAVVKAVAKAGLSIISGYMKADAIRKKANYEADILQLNADMQMFEAGEQQGVDFTKIIRYGEQVDEAVSNIQSEFTRGEQEGGAAQDVIAENSLQGRLNQMAMMNEAQAKVSSAEFAKKLSYLKAKQARDISVKQGNQAIQAGYLEALLGGL